MKTIAHEFWTKSGVLPLLYSVGLIVLPMSLHDIGEGIVLMSSALLQSIVITSRREHHIIDNFITPVGYTFFLLLTQGNKTFDMASMWFFWGYTLLAVFFFLVRWPGWNLLKVLLLWSLVVLSVNWQVMFLMTLLLLLPTPRPLASEIRLPLLFPHYPLRQVERAVLVMEIDNFTQWSVENDVEQVAAMLADFYEISETHVARGGGHKPEFSAGKVISRFAEAHTAVLTAADLRNCLQKPLAAYGLAIRIGLHIGQVKEGLVGSSYTQIFCLVGDIPIVAGYLCSMAYPNEILLSETLHEQVSHIAVVGSLRQIKNYTEIMTVYPLVGEKKTYDRFS